MFGDKWLESARFRAARDGPSRDVRVDPFRGERVDLWGPGKC